MNELFARLLQELATNGPATSKVQEILDEIRAKFPAELPRAQALVDATIIAKGGQPQPAPAPASSWLNSKGLIATLFAVGGGGAGLGISRLSWEQIQKPPLPPVTSQWTLFAIVAAVGAIVGLAHALYRNHWSLIYPVFSKTGGRFQIVSLGFVRNMLIASVVSVATAWMALSNVAVTTNGEGNEEKAVETKNTLLSWNVLASAVLAGVFGSKMASGEVETKTLWNALPTIAANPGDPGLAKMIEGAKTPFEAVTVATGSPPPGFVPPKNIAPQSAEIEAELLSLFDRASLKRFIETSGRPLDASGAGLTLAVLDCMQTLRTGLKFLLQSFELAVVANMTAEDFSLEAERRGIDRVAFKPLLDGVHSTAQRAMELLGSLPPTWNLTADRL